ncbi:MAG TPA: DUF4097 family beta strand repeat-containing protein [Thermoanaerobaculia bacterium]|nr:DUF4097 family beta strand repeat-containing protein [Thermoanaerobaculia bacterium]
MKFVLKSNSRVPELVAALLLLLGARTSGVQAAEQTRALHQAFPGGAAEVRLANLAGRLEIVPGPGREVVVDATIHGDADGTAETQRILAQMKWVKSHDKKGREEWALSYPVEKYRSYSYPRDHEKEGNSELPAFLSFLNIGSQTVITYRGERVRIYSQKHSSAPVLYADLRITLPAGSNVAVRNAVGAVHGGDLDGTLAVDTGSGKVQIASHSGQLTVDTGSGDVVLGSAKGETTIDTGSGDVVVKRLVGNGKVNTGSGSVTVSQVSAGKLVIETGSGDVTVQDGVAARLIADTGSGGVKVLSVELEELAAETGSGDVTVQSSLAKAKKIKAETGSGDIVIKAGPDASFNIDSDQGSGSLVVNYGDATLRKAGRKVVGAKRGDGRTAIHVETGSGDCTIGPKV